MAVLQHQHMARLSAVINAQRSHLARLFRRFPAEGMRRIARISLLGYCCYVFAGMFWLLLPLPELVQPAPGQLLQMQSAAPQGSRQDTVDIEAIKSFHLFGSAGDAATLVPKPAVVLIDAEDTHLDLLLLGVVVSDIASSGRAIIAHRNQQDLFAIGDSLPGGSQVQLEQVLPGRVIINNAGHYESLWLYQDDSSSQGAKKPVQRVAKVERRAQIPATLAVAQIPAAVVEELPAVRPEASNPVAKPETLADIIKFTPVHANGRVLGYRIAPGRSPRLFQHFGLKKNDVITGVNGITLDDPTKALKVYRQIQGSKSANFELMRDGKTHLVEIVLDGNHA
jgi:general secretion pathway protein C